MKYFTKIIDDKPTSVVYLTATECGVLKENGRTSQNTLEWGTYGPDGTNPLAIRYLKDLDTEHLENILITQPSIGHYLLIKAAALSILKERYHWQSMKR